MDQITPDRKSSRANVYWVPDDTHAQVHPSPQYVGFNTSYDPGHHQAVNSPPTSATPFHAAPAESFCSGYKPTALRWWYHLLLIICLAGFIGLTEYAIRNLAVYNNDAVSKMIHARSVDQIFSRMTSFVDVHLHLDRPRQEASGDVTIATAPTTPDQLTTATNPAQDTPSAAVAASTAPDVEVTSPVPIPTDDGKGVQGQTTVTSPETTPTQVTTSLRPGDGGLVGETTISAPSVPTTTDDGAGLQDETSVSLPPALTPTNEGDGVQVQTTQTATVTDPNAGIQTKTTTDGGAGVVSQTTVKVGATPDPNAGMVGSTTLSATVAFTTGSGGLATETTLTDDTNDVAGATGLVVGQNIRTSLTNNVAVTPTVAVVQQTTVVPASEANVVMTRTAANGAVIQETVKTFIPAQTNVLSQSITVNRGQVLTTMSTVSAVVGGGTTQVLATTSTDANGRVTSFSHTTVIGGTTSSATMQLVFATTPSAADRNANVKVLTTSDAEYITGAFLATILAVLMSFPLRLIGINAKLMQPFNTLARASTVRGAAAQHSVFLRYYDWTGAFSFFLAIRDGQPVVAISDTLSLLAGLLSPVAATTASIHVDDGCTSHCFGSLGISVGPGRALQALLGLIMALLAVLILIIGVLRWETGVNQNPWSIAGMASLCRDPELRERLMRLPRGMSGCVSEGDVLRILRQRSYALGCFWQPQGASSPRVGYGVMVAGTGDATCQFLRPDDERVCPEAESSSRVRKCQPFAVLTWWGRSGILFLYSSVLILVTYYGTTGGDTGFERFMDSQTYGVKFLFTGIGVVLGITMNTFFRCVAVLWPYVQLSRQPQPAERTILLSPPTNGVSGLRAALRHRSPYLASLALTTLLAELCLPVVLSHVPFSRADKLSTEKICIWISVTVLALMLLVVLASLVVDWPHMPVDPRTIAGAMFYVCDSRVLGQLEGMAVVSKKERDLEVRHLRSRYGFGVVRGVSGGERMGVDVCDSRGEAAEMVREKRGSTTLHF